MFPHLTPYIRAVPLTQIVYIFANINYLHYYITKKEIIQVYNDVNEQIKTALLKRATGYEVEEKEIIIDKNKKDTGKVKVIKKHIPPDLNAIKTITSLIQRGEW